MLQELFLLGGVYVVQAPTLEVGFRGHIAYFPLGAYAVQGLEKINLPK